MPTYIGTTGADDPGLDNTNNELYGLGGDDIINAGYNGDVYIYGGNGNDTLNKQDASTGSGEIYGDDGDDTIDGASGSDEIYGGDDRDYITAYDGDDYVDGGQSSDAVFGQIGNDTLYGGSGTDRVDGGDGNDILYGGDDDDTNTISFIAGVDHATVIGGLYGGAGDDYLDGGQGNDYLDGGTDSDTLLGGEGNDILDGGTGVDQLDGGRGNDTYYVDSASDKVSEFSGQGSDTVRASASYKLSATSEIETLRTAAQSTWSTINLTGNDLVQSIFGNDDANKLVGLGGNDELKGSDGNDRLYGGLGNDTLVGGAGKDQFFFDTKPNASTNHDVIADFKNLSENNDTIYLDDAIFTTLVNRELGGAFQQNTTGLATQADDRIIYETDTGNLFYDSNGTAAGGSVLFATLTGHPTITVSDFIVF